MNRLRWPHSTSRRFAECPTQLLILKRMYHEQIYRVINGLNARGFAIRGWCRLFIVGEGAGEMKAIGKATFLSDLFYALARK